MTFLFIVLFEILNFHNILLEFLFYHSFHYSKTEAIENAIMISPENRQEKDIISFTYVLFIGTIMPIKNSIKPINNNIIFSIYYINFIIYFIIYAKILKNIVITKLINNCYDFLSLSLLYNSSMNKLIKKAIGRYIIQNNIEYILRFRKYNNTHVNITYNKILNVIRIVFILFVFYAKIYKNIILSKLISLIFIY